MYKARCNDYLLETIINAFESNNIQASYNNYSALIEPYGTTELLGYSFLNNANDFYEAVEKLIEHSDSQTEAVGVYLGSQ